MSAPDSEEQLGMTDQNSVQAATKQDLTIIKPNSSQSVKTTKENLILSSRIETIHKPQYIVDNLNLFYALCEVDDWNFAR